MAKNTKQDDKGDEALYKDVSNATNSGEHSESAADQDVNDYYRELSARRSPNYDRNANLQIKQAPHDLSPADGGEGFVGSNTGPDVGLTMIEGKKGYSENLPIWEEKSSFTDYPDNTGSTGNSFDKPGEDSRDELASWKHAKSDAGLPQTHRTAAGAGDAGPADQVSESGGGNPNTQSTPGSDAGDHDMSMPQTEFTHLGGGGAPAFKFSGQEAAPSVYRPKPRD